jgi:hypothetical protein
MVYTGANGEFELTVRKRKVYPVAVEGWAVVSGAEIDGRISHDCCRARPLKFIKRSLRLSTKSHRRELKRRRNQHLFAFIAYVPII